MNGKNENNNHNIISEQERAFIYLSKRKTCIKNQISEVQREISTLGQQISELERTLEMDREKKDVNYSLFSPYKNHELNSTEDKIKNTIDEVQEKIKELKKQEENLLNEQSNTESIESLLQENVKKLQKNTEDTSEDGTKNKKCDLFGKRIDKLGLMIIDAQEIERKRIARELHDTTVQNLTGLMHKAELCTKLVDMDIIRTKLELIMIMNTLRNTINDMRTIIYDLRPMSLTDLGLVATIESYLADLKNKTGLQTALFVNNEEQIVSPIINLAIYRVIQEACNNVIKHANATSIVIKLDYLENMLQLIITDDGNGFDSDLVLNEEKATDIRNFGLSIMRERIHLLSGKIKIESKMKQGTKVFIEVPYCKDEGEVQNEHY